MTPIHFIPEPGVPPTVGTLVYNSVDESLDFETQTPRLSPLFGLVLGTLQLDVATDSGIVLFPWGYWPATGWTAGSVAVPTERVVAAVRVDMLEGPPPRGAAVELHGGPTWVTTYDQTSGWIGISLPARHAAEATAIEFASNCVMWISDDDLVGLLLRPEWR